MKMTTKILDQEQIQDELRTSKCIQKLKIKDEL